MRVVATAGHVDHGKSSLVRALTGTDPDRFPDLSLTIVKLLGPGEYVLDRAGPADDEAHFGLGVAKYVHSTAPNRRYADLINQRLLKATDAGLPLPYTDAELDEIAKHCTEREQQAHQIERTMRKRLAAAALVDRVGQTFDAIVDTLLEDGRIQSICSQTRLLLQIVGEPGS